MIRKLFLLFITSCTWLLALNTVSGGRLTPRQEAIDVKHYTIDITVDPFKQIISGVVEISFTLFRNIDLIELDLINNYSVSGTEINGMSLAFTHKKNKLFVNNPGLEPFIENKIKIKYAGRPPIAKNPPWDGGLTWATSEDGSSWVGVSCQSNGAHIWYPCKEHPSDKANGADIHITAPPGVMVVSNGLMQSSVVRKDKWNKWHWKTNYPISTYNINFTIGNFKIIEKQVFINKDKIDLVFYVLPEKENGGFELLKEAEKHLRFFTQHFGSYPWKNEKFGLVHTPYSGMEHQTINAYGNNYQKTSLGYDFILFHEMGHEWWGNFLSVADWSDFWIHEGFDTYAEAMYVEETYGIESARNFIERRFKKNIKNISPLVPPRHGTAEQKSGNDSYYKGAHVLHMLRYLIGKDVLWDSLKEFLYMPKELPNNQTSSDEFISLIEENSSEDLNWFFSQYLFKEELPVLNIKEKNIDNKRFIDLWWKNDGFKMPIEIEYVAIDGIRKKKIDLNNSPKRIVVQSDSGLLLDPNAWLLFTINNIND